MSLYLTLLFAALLSAAGPADEVRPKDPPKPKDPCENLEDPKELERCVADIGEAADTVRADKEALGFAGAYYRDRKEKLRKAAKGRKDLEAKLDGLEQLFAGEAAQERTAPQLEASRDGVKKSLSKELPAWFPVKKEDLELSYPAYVAKLHSEGGEALGKTQSAWGQAARDVASGKVSSLKDLLFSSGRLYYDYTSWMTARGINHVVNTIPKDARERPVGMIGEHVRFGLEMWHPGLFVPGFQAADLMVESYQDWRKAWDWRNLAAKAAVSGIAVALNPGDFKAGLQDVQRLASKGQKAVAGLLGPPKYKPETFTASPYTVTVGGRTQVIEPKFVAAEQAFDETGRLAFSVNADRATGGLNISFAQKVTGEGLEHFSVPGEAIAKGVQVRVNGKVLDAKAVSMGGVSGSEYLQWAAAGEAGQRSTIDILFQGQGVGKYVYDPAKKQLTRMAAPRSLSAFDERLLAQGAEVTPTLIDRTRPPINQVDLHTHFSGALRSESLLEAAKRYDMPYPTELLDKAGVRYNDAAAFMVNGKPHITLSQRNFPAREGLAKLEKALSIPADKTITFQDMEILYALRRPLTKDARAVEFYLEELAKDYQRMGVKYAELSIWDVLDPKWMARAHEVLPGIEARTGVSMRFDAALSRRAGAASNMADIEMLKAVGKDKYIVGVDFHGFENNPTSTFSQELAELAKIRKARPDFQVRVHAGENPNFLGNVKEAVEGGATRIGHGVYGVDAKVLAEARRRGAIIELNPDSNLALKNIQGYKDLQHVADYVRSGNRVTLGSDGHGLYNTTPHSEEAVLKALGLSESELRRIARSDAKYVETILGTGPKPNGSLPAAWLPQVWRSLMGHPPEEAP